MKTIPAAILATQKAFEFYNLNPSFPAKIAYIRTLHDGCRALRSLTFASRRRVLRGAQSRLATACQQWDGGHVLLPLQILCLFGESLPGIPSSYPQN